MRWLVGSLCWGSRSQAPSPRSCCFGCLTRRTRRRPSWAAAWVALPFLVAAGMALVVRRHPAALVTLLITLLVAGGIGVSLLNSSATQYEAARQQAATAVGPGEDPGRGRPDAQGERGHAACYRRGVRDHPWSSCCRRPSSRATGSRPGSRSVFPARPARAPADRAGPQRVNTERLSERGQVLLPARRMGQEVVRPGQPAAHAAATTKPSPLAASPATLTIRASRLAGPSGAPASTPRRRRETGGWPAITASHSGPTQAAPTSATGWRGRRPTSRRRPPARPTGQASSGPGSQTEAGGS